MSSGGVGWVQQQQPGDSVQVVPSLLQKSVVVSSVTVSFSLLPAPMQKFIAGLFSVRDA